MPKHHDVFESVAPTVCNKPVDIPHYECWRTLGSRNPLCRDYGKCRLYEKTYEQFKYVLHPKTLDSFLRACPGSGKTEVVGMKAAYEIRRWDYSHAGIAVLTFTNSAADVIRERIVQFTGKMGYPHYVGTFDSWLHAYLANPFAYSLTHYAGKDGDCSLRVIDTGSREEWLNAYRCNTPFICDKNVKKAKETGRNDALDKLAGMPIFANNFWYDPETTNFIIKPYHNTNYLTDHVSYYRSEAFQEYVANKKTLTLDELKLDFGKCKKLFWKAGFVNHQDVEYLSQLLLNKDSIRSRFCHRFPMVIIDECQDLSWGQLKILELLRGEETSVHLVGDTNQAIYAFKKVSPETVEKFVCEGKFHKLELQENFRSVQPIVDLCGKLVDQGKITGRSKASDDPVCVYFLYEAKDISQLPLRCKIYLQSKSISIEKSAILTRGYAVVNKLRPAAVHVPSNDSVALATSVVLWKIPDVQAMEEALKCAGRCISSKFFPKQPADSRHYYCPKDEKSAVEWRLFLARVLDACMENADILNLDQTWSVWAKAVRTNFGRIVAKAFHGELPDYEKFKFTALNGKSSVSVRETLDLASMTTKTGMCITTIHQAKGKTFEAVMVVSSPTRQGDGGHWRQWLDKTSSGGEHSRFAYVASSRPAKLLIWAIPKDVEDSVTELENLGFIKDQTI